jgi:two-component system, OmpR family, catabolic regulation response regulator CreB
MNAKPLILIVEDEPGIADTLQYALRTDGFDPLWCATGAAALKAVDTLALDAMAPDLVLLDVGLPDINGFELYKKLRETPTLTPHLPIIFLTARSDEIDRVVGLELGADDYVTKPFSPRELVARVRSVLRRVSSNTSGALDGSTKTSPTVTRHGPFTVDEGRRRIRYYQQPVELSRYEYGLLKTLVARPGIVFTRDQLLDLVWDNASDSIDRTVDAHVKTLRAKLKAVAPQLEPIRTHRGTGYALAEDLPSKLS